MKPTVTIGISALNEEANIKDLLASLLVQKGDFVLEKIIVISDGSTDNTVSLTQSVGDSHIVFVDGKEREGKAIRQNEICKMAESDVLVILDADTLPENDLFVSKLIAPIVTDTAIGLTSGPNVSINPKNFFEKVLTWGVGFKTDLFESVSVDNVFLCVGADRAFSKGFYKKIKWPPGYPEDGYSYLSALNLGYKFQYVSSAKIIFRVPDNFRDHLKQSRRFISSPNKLKKYFDANFVDKNYKIPTGLFVSKMIVYFIRNPLYAVCYAFICLYPRIIKNQDKMVDKWEIASSTKKLT